MCNNNNLYMKKKLANKLSGFTLIELMVVITIIGILAVIVLPNLTSVRGRGQDTAIKEQMTQFRATAAIYYDDYYGYTTGAQAAPVSAACLPTTNWPAGSVFTTSDFSRVVAGIQSNSAFMPNCYLGTGATSAQSWAMVARLRTATGSSPSFWCVDDAGNSKRLSADSGIINGSNQAVCP